LLYVVCCTTRLVNKVVCVATPYQTSWQHSDGDPTGASNAGVVSKNRDCRQISGYRSMTAAVRDQQLAVVSAVVYNSYGARLSTAPPSMLRIH